MKEDKKEAPESKPINHDKKEKTAEQLKQEEEADNLGKEFTGEGFMNYDDLVKIVKEYQQRTFAEDVDFLEKLGGKHFA